MINEELVKMARLAQRDDRMATGALYGDLADRIEALTAEVRRWHGLFDEKHRLMLEEKAKADALTEQLEAARADAKEAEAYAEGLERDLKTCRMAQVVMDNTVAELERERDRQYDENVHRIAEEAKAEARAEAAEAKLATCEKYRDAYAECDRIGTQAVRDLETKLAKALEALRKIAAEASVPVHTWKNGINFKKMYEGWRKVAVQRIDKARATLAEIEGEKG
jgi:chromosome segregation ATPase